jgi:ACS family hexuronate transporter-like MFS transporter
MARPFDTEIKSIPTSSIASVAAPSEFGRVHKTMTTAYSRERELLVLVSLLFSWMLANADRIAMTIAIIPITQEFRLDAQSAGYVLSAFYVSYALMQLGGG